jgi:hypothetical protein
METLETHWEVKGTLWEHQNCLEINFGTIPENKLKPAPT